MRWADFTKACGYWLRHARRDRDPDPDKTDRDHRKISLHDGLRGTGLLTGELTPTAKAEVRTELERLERQLFEADWPRQGPPRRRHHGRRPRPHPRPAPPRRPRRDGPPLGHRARQRQAPPAPADRPGRRGRLPQRARAHRRHAHLLGHRGRPPRRGRRSNGSSTTARPASSTWASSAASSAPPAAPSRSSIAPAPARVVTSEPTCARSTTSCRGPISGPTRPDNGEPKCRPHHRQRQHQQAGPVRQPADPGARAPDRRRTPSSWHEPAVRDRMLHDPAWGAVAPVPIRCPCS